VIETRDLTKRFRSRKRGIITAVDRLNLRCSAGEVYALLGPNGAGKTTTLRMLSTLITPTTGDALILGHSVSSERAAIRRTIGVVSCETGVYDRMTPREIARYFGRLNDLDADTLERRMDQVFALLNMEGFVDERTDDFSTGMIQKTVIMRALLTDPRILIFDEPTVGLDILTARNVLEYIRLLKGEGKTIVFSTHVMREAEKLADRIGIIDRGRLVAEGTLAELQQETSRTDLEDIFFSLVRR